MPVMAVIYAILVARHDLTSRRVPNELVLAALLLAACWNAWTIVEHGSPAAVLIPAVGGLLIGLAALLPFHAIGWMGAGDVKYFASIGFMLGWESLLPVWIVGSLLAGVHVAWIALGYAFGPRQPAWMKPSGDEPAAVAVRSRAGTPYAACLSVGVVGYACLKFLQGASA
jgi:prepilin peptidase CpaA